MIPTFRLSHLALVLLLQACGSKSPELVDPQSSTPELDRLTSSNADGFQLRWESSAETPPLNEEYNFAFSLSRPDGAPLDLPADQLRIDACMPHHGHGMNQDPVIEGTGPGGYTVRGMRLHMTGRWDVYVDVRQGAVTERAEFALELE